MHSPEQTVAAAQADTRAQTRVDERCGPQREQQQCEDGDLTPAFGCGPTAIQVNDKNTCTPKESEMDERAQHDNEAERARVAGCGDPPMCAASSSSGTAARAQRALQARPRAPTAVKSAATCAT